jgi:hypothetical protein
MMMKLTFRHLRRETSEKYNKESSVICQCDIRHYTDTALVYDFTYHGAIDEPGKNVFDEQSQYDNYENEDVRKDLEKKLNGFKDKDGLPCLLIDSKNIM